MYQKRKRKHLVDLCKSSFYCKVRVLPCKFMYLLFVARDPLRHRRADLKVARETFVRIHDMVVGYSFPFLLARSSASLLWYLLHSSAIPPVVVNTKSVKVACSTSIIFVSIHTFRLVFVLAIYLLRVEVFIRICIN